MDTNKFLDGFLLGHSTLKKPPKLLLYIHLFSFDHFSTPYNKDHLPLKGSFICNREDLFQSTSDCLLVMLGQLPGKGCLSVSKNSHHILEAACNPVGTFIKNQGSPFIPYALKGFFPICTP